MSFPRFLLALVLFFQAGFDASAATAFAKGDSVRLTRSETLLFKGQNFLGAPKGQDFTVLQHDGRGPVFVAFYKADGTLIAVTLPADALEASPADPWADLLHGVEAFRDRRIDDCKRLLTRAALEGRHKTLAANISARINGALATAAGARTAAGRQTFSTALQGLRDTAEQLAKDELFCLALPLDEGADWLAAQVPDAAPGTLPASKLDHTDLAKRVATSNRAVALSRQSIALHRLIEASKIIEEGLAAEPGRPDLKRTQVQVQKDIDEAGERYKAADSMRKFYKGEVHALTALEIGLKLCVDHPQLLALRKEMNGAYEQRTAPEVTPAFLAAAKVKTPAAALTEGHKLYTSRCTECHDLELIDSRGNAGWQKAVASMSRRANLSDAEQSRILDYLAAAQITVQALEEK